MQKQKKIEV